MKITLSNWARLLRDKMIKHQGLPVTNMEISDLISDDPGNGLIQGLDGKLFIPLGATPHVLYFSRKDGEPLLTTQKPEEDQWVLNRTWRPIIWGEWVNIEDFRFGDEFSEDINVSPKSLFKSKLWLSSDMAIPDAQLRLTIKDARDETDLSIATSSVNLNNINTIFTPATFINQFLVSKMVPLNSLYIALSIRALTSAVQFGIISNSPAKLSFATIFSNN